MPNALRRAWDAPVAAHLAALLLVLGAGAVFVGTYASLSSDEGAAIVQARQLAEHGDWIRPHPYPDVDPDGRYYTYTLSERGENGFAPFAKHPLYALVLSWLWPIGGINALVGLSIAATVAAAAVASRFGRRIDPSLERPALWLTGVGSPLLFDSYLVIAHTIGAALAGGLLLLLTRRSASRPALALAAAGGLAAALVLMRTEGVLLVGAAAAVAVVGRQTRWMGLAAGIAGVGAYVAEQAWTERIVGKAVVIQYTAEEVARERARSLGGGGLAGRLDGAWVTLFRPEYGSTEAGLLLLLTLLAFAGAVVVARMNGRLAAGFALLGAVCAVLRLIVAPIGLVPGLFVAAPIVWAGLWAAATTWGQRTLRLDGRLLAVLGLFTAGVLATQYSRGGGVEWGGRFFALVLPVAVPMAVAALRLQPAIVFRCVLVAAAALSLGALRNVEHFHRRTEDALAGVRIPPRTVAITTADQIPRLDWRRYDERKWLLVPRRDVADLLTRLRAEGFERASIMYSSGQRPPGVRGTATNVGDTRWATIDVELD